MPFLPHLIHHKLPTDKIGYNDAIVTISYGIHQLHTTIRAKRRSSNCKGREEEEERLHKALSQVCEYCWSLTHQLY